VVTAPAKTILVVEDESNLREVVLATLDLGEYRILETADGVGALACARRERLDLVVLDWAMPGMSGIEVLRALRADPATAAIPVLMLTARTQARDRQEAERLGVAAYLTKPFSPLRLVDTVRSVLGDGR
jgi:CheY-like chemotaxis protein